MTKTAPIATHSTLPATRQRRQNSHGERNGCCDANGRFPLNGTAALLIEGIWDYSIVLYASRGGIFIRCDETYLRSAAVLTIDAVGFDSGTAAVTNRIHILNLN